MIVDIENFPFDKSEKSSFKFISSKTSEVYSLAEFKKSVIPNVSLLLSIILSVEKQFIESNNKKEKVKPIILIIHLTLLILPVST